MKNIGRGLLILFSTIAMASCTTASAGRTSSGTVAANRSTSISFLAVATRYGECRQSAQPSMHVTEKPQHGSVRFNWATGRIGELASRCKNGIRGMDVIYTPDRNYRGNDSFTITMSYPQFVGESANGASAFSRYSYNITVK